jgi:hypothetical protein
MIPMYGYSRQQRSSDTQRANHKNTQEWEALLNAVGGKLEISKCQISKFSWEMEISGQMTLQPQITNEPITITDHESGRNIQI